MWWHETRGTARWARVAAALALAVALGGCFQPLYGERSVDGTPTIRSKLSGVEVGKIDAPAGTIDSRIGVEVRNALIFAFTGGGGSPAPTHRLTINVRSNRLQVIVDTTSTRPDVENYSIDAYYTLTDIETGKVVLTGTTTSRVSYDIPGQQQRFARSRGLRDAETRASQLLADNIRNRLASFFVAGA